MNDVVHNATILTISESIVEKTIELKRLKRTKTADAIVAATALIHNLKLITRNTKDFSHLDLRIINAHDL
jgi:predicted nucleic acid-binding protein